MSISPRAFLFQVHLILLLLEDQTLGGFEVEIEYPDYSELEEYEGAKTKCDQCDREFNEGEVVTVSRGKDYVFCFTGLEGGCMIAHTFDAGEVMFGEAMRFGGSPVLPPDNPTPNYPNMPLNKTKREQLAWLRKMLS